MLSTYGANAVLNGTGIPATLYVKLHTGNPGSNGLNNAAALSTRKAFTRTTAVGGVCTNDTELEWLGAPSDENVTHASLWDHLTTGNCWGISLANPGPVDLDPGFAFVIVVGGLTLAMTVWS